MLSLVQLAENELTTLCPSRPSQTTDAPTGIFSSAGLNEAPEAFTTNKGELVGEVVGELVGEIVGKPVVGVVVGEVVGDTVGAVVGEVVGEPEGGIVGAVRACARVHICVCVSLSPHLSFFPAPSAFVRASVHVRVYISLPIHLSLFSSTSHACTDRGKERERGRVRYTCARMHVEGEERMRGEES